MKLARKLVFGLLLGTIAVLALSAWIRVAREVEMFNRDMQRDDLLVGRAIATGVSRAWRVEGETAAISLVRAFAASASHVRVRWVWLDGKGERETLRIALREGTQYALVALCDEDCRDLEVTVLGEDDAVLAKSAGWGDRPLLEVQPRATGKYRIVVTMAHCGSGPCAYGVGVFMK